MFSDSIQQISRLTGGGSIVGHPVLRASVLRPSVLGPSRLGSALTNNVTSSNDASDGAVATASGGCKGAVRKTSNIPFLKDHKDDDEAEECDNGNKNSEAGDNGEYNDEAEEPPDPLSLLCKNRMERSNLFAAAKNSIPLVEKSGFVFGQNVQERVLEVNSKLFAFVNSIWEERGRCSLRLIDSKIEYECSRLELRPAGNLRLLLNTKVWAGMVTKRLSQKSLLFTAIDNTGKIKIFLVMARPIKISQLNSFLVERIDKCKISHLYE